MDQRQAEKMLKALKHGDPGRRREALDALVNMEAPQALEASLELMGDPEVAVRWGAARALGTFGDPRAIPLLKSALLDPFLRDVAHASLTALGATDAAPEAIWTALFDHVSEIAAEGRNATGHICRRIEITPAGIRVDDPDNAIEEKRHILVPIEDMVCVSWASKAKKPPGSFIDKALWGIEVVPQHRSYFHIYARREMPLPKRVDTGTAIERKLAGHAALVRYLVEHTLFADEWGIVAPDDLRGRALEVVAPRFLAHIMATRARNGERPAPPPTWNDELEYGVAFDGVTVAVHTARPVGKFSLRHLKRERTVVEAVRFEVASVSHLSFVTDTINGSPMSRSMTVTLSEVPVIHDPGFSVPGTDRALTFKIGGWGNEDSPWGARLRTICAYGLAMRCWEALLDEAGCTRLRAPSS